MSSSRSHVDPYDFYHLSGSGASIPGTTRKPQITTSPSFERRKNRFREKTSYQQQDQSPDNSMYIEAERPALHTMAYSRHINPYQSKKVSSNSSPSSVTAGPFDVREDDGFVGIVYSDPVDGGSVMTGMSQQELIRKKVRDSRKKQRYSNSKRKKKKKTVVQLIPNLLGNSQRVADKAREEPSNRETSHSKPKTPPKAQHDDLEHSTAESTNSESSPVTRVEERKTGRTVLDRFGPPPGESDHRSIGEDSFPILSRNATSGSTFQDSPASSTPPRSSGYRSVRFSAQIVAPSPDRNAAKPRITDLQPILRASPRFPATYRPHFRSPPRPSPAGSAALHVEDKSPGMALSPPREGLGFVDREGNFLSPIRPGSTREPSSHWLGHPAEKNIATKNASSIASSASVSVKEEEYPDPPLELNMDDESTVASTRMSGFLETVAAIVIQTTFRRYLAMKYVDNLKEMIAEEMHAEYLRRREASYLHEQQQHHHQQQQEQLRDEDAQMPIERGLPEVRSDKSPVRPLRNVRPSSPPPPVRSTPPKYRAETSFNINPLRGGAEQVGPHSVKGSFKEHEHKIALDMHTLAAIRIQSAFRGFWARDSLDVDHYCASIIQRYFQRYIATKRFRKINAHVVAIQSVWRRSLTRDHVAGTLGAVIFIQAVARRFLVRKRVGQFLERWCRERRPDKVADSKTWQQAMVASAFRARQIGELATSDQNPPRSLSRTSRNREERAALRIQSRYRSYACEMSFIRSLVDILIVQTIVRRWLAIRTATHLRSQQNCRQIDETASKTQRNADTDLLAMWRARDEKNSKQRARNI